MQARIFSAIAIIFTAVSFNANAGGAATAVVGGATLPEQLIQSGMLNNQLGKQAQMVIQQATMIQKQIEQKNELLLLNRSLNPAVLNNELNQNRQDMKSLQTYIGALTTLSNDSAQAREAAVSRVLDMKNSGLSYEEYAQQERNLIEGGNKQRRQLAAHEKSLLENVNNDVQFVQEVQAKIPTTVGAHESTQLLNTQMNRMVAQNATMIQLMAANSKLQKDEVEKKDVLNKIDEQKMREQAEKDKAGVQRLIDGKWSKTTSTNQSSSNTQPLTAEQKRALGF